MDTLETLYNYEEPVRGLGIDVPRWIDQDIDGSTIVAILQGGCASGAYMPAVTYHDALRTMNEYGDDVWDFIDESVGLEDLHMNADNANSWADLACAYVSFAVELWASSVENEIADALDEDT